jgi:sec-independent protein translocase protein TatB
MLSLDPAKILVVLVIALIVLGPEKLPGVARQLGALWGDVRRWRARLETEVRGAFPDLPPAYEITQAVRSPLRFLDRLAEEHERNRAPDATVADDGGGTRAPPGTVNGSGPPPAPAGTPCYGREGIAEERASALPAFPDDPSMN